VPDVHEEGFEVLLLGRGRVVSGGRLVVLLVEIVVMPLVEIVVMLRGRSRHPCW
jgi:hypothetical protein